MVRITLGVALGIILAGVVMLVLLRPQATVTVQPQGQQQGVDQFYCLAHNYEPEGC